MLLQRIQLALEKKMNDAIVEQYKIHIKKQKEQYEKEMLSQAIKDRSNYFWYIVTKKIKNDKFENASKLLDRFYEANIRDLRQYIGVTPINGGGVQGNSRFQMIGHALSEPTQNQVNLISDILMYTKYKMIVMT